MKKEIKQESSVSVYNIKDEEYCFNNDFFEKLYLFKRNVSGEQEKVFRMHYLEQLKGLKKSKELDIPISESTLKNMRNKTRRCLNLEEVKVHAEILGCDYMDLLKKYEKSEEVVMTECNRINQVQIMNLQACYELIYDFVYKYYEKYETEELTEKYYETEMFVNKKKPFLTRKSYKVLRNAIEEILYPLILDETFEDIYIDTGEWKENNFIVTDAQLFFMKDYKIWEIYASKVDKLGEEIYKIVNGLE